MKQAIKSSLRETDTFFKTVVSKSDGYYERNKFGTVAACGKQPCKGIGGASYKKKTPPWLIASSHRTNPGQVKPLHFPNQDAYAVYTEGKENGDPIAILSLMDGHGSNGHFVSMVAATFATKYIYENTDGLKNTPDDWEEFFKKCFSRAEKACKDIDMSMSGATGTIVLVASNLLVQANVGDSLAVMVHDNGHEVLTIEDKPSKPDEAARIKASGGKVINLSGSLRVFPIGLAITRAIGDLGGRKYGIICVPHVVERKMSSEVRAIFSGSDGIWDETSPQAVEKMALSGDYSTAMHEGVIKTSQSKYQKSAGGYADDATLIYLNVTKLLYS